jgi:hypothetical protein
VQPPPEPQPLSTAQPPQAPQPNAFQRGWKWYRSQKAVVQVILAVLAVGVVIGIANASGGGQSNNSTSPTATARASGPTATPKPTAAPKPTAKSYPHFGDGTFQVGKDIQPGTYRTRCGSAGCYYARLSGFGGTVNEIIANNNTDAPAIVTIAASDKGFESENCGTWTKQ